MHGMGKSFIQALIQFTLNTQPLETGFRNAALSVSTICMPRTTLVLWNLMELIYYQDPLVRLKTIIHKTNTKRQH